MSISKILFSFSGRISREIFWCAQLCIWGAFIGIVFLAGIIGAEIGQGNESTREAVMPLLVLIYLCALWCSLAVHVKRWHDRAKSGSWVLLAFVPIIGPFWTLMEVGFLEGTPGPNEFDERVFSADGADEAVPSGPQIAGRHCVYCEQKIVSVLDAKLCRKCEEPVHLDCRREHVAGAHRSPAHAA